MNPIDQIAKVRAKMATFNDGDKGVWVALCEVLDLMGQLAGEVKAIPKFASVVPLHVADAKAAFDVTQLQEALELCRTLAGVIANCHGCMRAGVPHVANEELGKWMLLAPDRIAAIERGPRQATEPPPAGAPVSTVDSESKQVQNVTAELERLRKFKVLVHQFLDNLGIDKHADEPCRVANRIRDLSSEVDHLRQFKHVIKQYVEQYK